MGVPTLVVVEVVVEVLLVVGPMLNEPLASRRIACDVLVGVSVVVVV